MTISCGFFNSVSGDRLYDAVDLSRIFDGVIEDGIFASVGEGFIVTFNANLNVNVGSGRAWFNGTWTYNDAAVIETVSTADALLDRIDVVYLEIDTSNGVRNNSVGILAGTPASTPVAPTLTDDAYVHQYALAHIYVSAGTTTLTQSDITNKIGTSETPFVTGPLGGVSADSLLLQWQDQWDVWFAAIQGQLSSAAETNLQNQIYAIVGDVNPPLVTLVELDAHDHSDFGGLIVTDSIANNAVTTAKIPNRTRRKFVHWVALGRVESQSYASYPWGWVYQFSDSSAGDCMYGVLLVPSDYVSDLKAYVVGWAASGSGNVRFKLAYQELFDGAIMSYGETNSYGTAYFSGVGQPVSKDLVANISLSQSPTAVAFKLSRLYNDALDTLAGNARVMGLEFSYTADM